MLVAQSYGMSETGRYIIRASNPLLHRGAKQDYLAVLEVDVFRGFSLYHAIFRGGAFALRVQRNDDGRSSSFASQDPNWTVHAIRMIAQEDFLAKLKELTK